VAPLSTPFMHAHTVAALSTALSARSSLHSARGHSPRHPCTLLTDGLCTCVCVLHSHAIRALFSLTVLCIAFVCAAGALSLPTQCLHCTLHAIRALFPAPSYTLLTDTRSGYVRHRRCRPTCSRGARRPMTYSPRALPPTAPLARRSHRNGPCLHGSQCTHSPRHPMRTRLTVWRVHSVLCDTQACLAARQ
jgi:hypothetical protein